MKNELIDKLFEARYSEDIFLCLERVIKKITPQEFEKIFGVKYLQFSRLDPSLPEDFFEDMAKEATIQERVVRIWARMFLEHFSISDSINEMKKQIEEALKKEKFWEHLKGIHHRYLYGRQIDEGKTAPVFIAKVGDMLGEKFSSAGYGLFALDEITKGQFIGVATGNIERATNEKDQTNYSYAYRDDNSLSFEFVNSLRYGNSLRFINHSRNDNVISLNVFYNGAYVTFLVAKKDIPKNSQILLNYGEKYWRDKGINPLEF